MANKIPEKVHLNVIFRPEPEGGFTVLVPALPGCVTYGKDLKEARAMAVDAILGYLASLEKHSESIPSDEENFISMIEVPAKSFVHAQTSFAHTQASH